MTSSVQENVKMYLLYQAVTRYCMIYFINLPKIWIWFLECKYITLKNLTLKILKFCFYVMNYHNTFLEKNIKK